MGKYINTNLQILGFSDAPPRGHYRQSNAPQGHTWDQNEKHFHLLLCLTIQLHLSDLSYVFIYYRDLFHKYKKNSN